MLWQARGSQKSERSSRRKIAFSVNGLICAVFGPFGRVVQQPEGSLYAFTRLRPAPTARTTDSPQDLRRMAGMARQHDRRNQLAEGREKSRLSLVSQGPKLEREEGGSRALWRNPRKLVHTRARMPCVRFSELPHRTA